MSRPSTTIKQTKTDVKGSEKIVYPPDLESNARVYFNITFYRLGDNFIDRAFGESFEPDPSLRINLPCPEDLRHTFSMDYGKGDLLYLNLIRNAGGSIKDAITNLKKIYDDGGTIMGSDAEREFKKLLGEGGDVLQALGTQMFLTTNQTVGGLVGRAQKKVPNPLPTIFFNGMNLRTHVFNWRFVPRSRTESEVLHEMIRAFRNKVTPELRNDGNFLSYPSIIQVKLIDQSGGDMGERYGTKYLKSHVTDINFNYTAAGTSAFFYDGYPAAVEFTFTMQEIEQYLSENNTSSEDTRRPESQLDTILENAVESQLNTILENATEDSSSGFRLPGQLGGPNGE